jgi:DNA-binding MarR family transcriptional regulator
MQPYFNQFGITASQWGVLKVLYRAEQEGLRGLRATDVGERLLIKPPSVTNVLHRLQRMDLVSRDVSRTDLRAKRISLTSSGRGLVERILKHHGSHVDILLGGLTAAEQKHFLSLLSRLEQHLQTVIETNSTAEK